MRLNPDFAMQHPDGTTYVKLDHAVRIYYPDGTVQ